MNVKPMQQGDITIRKAHLNVKLFNTAQTESEKYRAQIAVAEMLYAVEKLTGTSETDALYETMVRIVQYEGSKENKSKQNR